MADNTTTNRGKTRRRKTKSSSTDVHKKEWLRPRDVKDLLGISDSRFHQLIKKKAFPYSQPDGGLIYIHRTHIDKFLMDGYKNGQQQSLPLTT